MKRPSPTMGAAAALAVIATAGCARAVGPQASLTPATHAPADSGRPAYTAPDVHFMAGMIVHHAQAVRIAGWPPAHGAGPALRAPCQRIVVGQHHQIAVLQRFLLARHY